MLPASKKSTLFFTHSYMMPLFSSPRSTARRLPPALRRQHADAGMAHDVLLADADIGHDLTARGRRGRIDQHAAIHLLILNFDPAATEAHFGALVGRAIKTLGKRTGDIGCDQACVLRL